MNANDAPTSPGFDDAELLRRYADERSEAAFAELVRRRIGLVYAVALRQTRGDRHRAEDATQAVFTDLARKARALAQRPVLIGWLHRSAHFAATALVRSEQRRQVREQEAFTMEDVLRNEGGQIDWDKVRPMLDGALNEIDERDRDAVLLRFFDQRPFAAIGAQLQLSENAARMRVERALDKLNAALARRGITSSTVAVGVALGQPVAAGVLPAGLAATVTGAALSQTAVSSAGWIAGMLAMGKMKAGLAGAVVASGVAGFVWQENTNASLQRDLAALREQQQAMATLRAENGRLAAQVAEVEVLRRDDLEYRQLAASIAEVQKTKAESARLARLRADEQVNSRTVQAEIDRLNREGNALVEQFKALNTQAKDPALTAEQKSTAAAAAKTKLAEIQAKQREVQAYIAANRSVPVPNSPLTLEEDLARRRQARDSFTALEDGRVSVRMPEADHVTLLSAYERIANVRIERDASLASVRTIVNLQSEPRNREEMVEFLRSALRERMNIVLEPDASGRLVARLHPPRGP